MKKQRKIVLAYSGGLDTSIILKWLQENYNAEIIAYTADIGQKIDKKRIINNAKKLGVKKIIVENLKDIFAKDYVFPIIRAPKKLKREPSRLFVSFRPAENIKNEISVTNGYDFKLKAPVTAKSGKKSYDLFSKGRFAWVVDNEDEKKLIVTMKKASRLMIVGNSQKGDQTTDHYSMMGFTKAYNSAKKSCS